MPSLLMLLLSLLYAAEALRTDGIIDHENHGPFEGIWDTAKIRIPIIIKANLVCHRILSH